MTDDGLREHREIHLVNDEVGAIEERGYGSAKEQRSHEAIDDKHHLKGPWTKEIA